MNCEHTIRHFCRGLIFALVLGTLTTTSAAADSSSPLLAAYYDRQMAIVGGAVYAWEGVNAPRRLAFKAAQVGVGRDTFYVLTEAGDLLAFRYDAAGTRTLASGVARFAAGDDGVLAIKSDGGLWWIQGGSGDPRRIADNVASAAVGDGANYYVTRAGALFVRGKAHRGQYGDGRLQATERFIETASSVAAITAHTGHAILLKSNGEVMGTGGNIYGPVGRHGLGDKADRWSLITSGARAIATGSSHSLAILADDTLVAWGRDYDPEPVEVMADVTAVAAGSYTTIALGRDGTLWQWGRGKEPRQLILK